MIVTRRSPLVGPPRIRRSGRQPANWSILVALTLLLTAIPAGIAAQTGSSQDTQDRPDREEMLRRVVEHFERRLVRELNLDRSQVEAIHEITASMRDERRELFHRRRELKERLESFVEGDGGDREARRILADIRAVRAEEARIEAEEEARLLEVLSPAQVLRFQAMRDELSERIRRIHRGREGRSDSSGRENGGPGLRFFP